MNSTYSKLWPGSVFVVEWDLLDDAGNPMTTATVVGTVTKPPPPGSPYGTVGSSAPMDISHVPGSATYRGSYRPTMAGEHTWKLESELAGQGVIEGTFVVSRESTGAAPIQLDPTTPVGMMRLLTTDVDEAFPILDDNAYLALLALEGGVVKKGAAAALEAMSTSEVLRAKKITTQDLSIDGPAVAEDLRKRAKLLRDQVRQDIVDSRDDDDNYGLDFVDYDPHRARWPHTAELAEPYGGYY